MKLPFKSISPSVLWLWNNDKAGFESRYFQKSEMEKTTTPVGYFKRRVMEGIYTAMTDGEMPESTDVLLIISAMEEAFGIGQINVPFEAVIRDAFGIRISVDNFLSADPSGTPRLEYFDMSAAGREPRSETSKWGALTYWRKFGIVPNTTLHRFPTSVNKSEVKIQWPKAESFTLTWEPGDLRLLEEEIIDTTEDISRHYRASLGEYGPTGPVLDEYEKADAEYKAAKKARENARKRLSEEMAAHNLDRFRANERLFYFTERTTFDFPEYVREAEARLEELKQKAIDAGDAEPKRTKIFYAR